MGLSITEIVQAALADQPPGAVLTTRELVAAAKLDNYAVLFGVDASQRMAALGLYRQAAPETRFGRTSRRRYWSLTWGRPDDAARIEAAETRQSPRAKRGDASLRLNVHGHELGGVEARLARLEAQVTTLASQLERTLLAVEGLTKA